jgi:serine/threonine protein kinase
MGDSFGRYTVERELGRGASAIVYLARDPDHGRAVAIKVLRPELREGITAERFLREIGVTAQLHHPNIVPVLDSGEAEGKLYFTLPYMDGGTLRDRLRRDKQLPIEDVFSIGQTILGALALAHGRNVLHRDVKPENILFAGGQACLSDFGIARAVERASGDESTTSGIVRGTPAYMSPEQAAGNQDYDGRSDLYSLACVLYETLAGVPAFVGATQQAVIAQRFTTEPRSVSVYRPKVSPRLEAVLTKALATAPADRYQTADEFAAALSSAQAAPGTRRTPRVSPLGLTVGALAVVALAGALYLGRDSIAERFIDNVPLDTAKIAIFPFNANDAGEVSPDALLAEAMRRWRGLTVAEPFEVGDAVRRFGLPSGASEARTLARRIGAGRFIRGTARGTGTQLVSATLYDTRSGAALYAASHETGPPSTPDRSGYAALADSLALRGAHADISTIGPDSTRNLPATQSMVKAGLALGEWDLAAAESLFVRSLEYEPSSARAAFWIAQIRSWRGQPPDTWRDFAARGAQDAPSLTTTEQRMSEALNALGSGDFQRACQLYTAITEQRPRDFAAWFGRGQCIEYDNIVVPDASTASHWRFRASYQGAIDAYIRAFEVLPSTYRNFQGTAYAPLARLLYVNSRNRRSGRTADGKKRFLGSLAAANDTIVFLVEPREMVGTARSGEDQRATGDGNAKMRSLFHHITSTWASAFPRSAAAKEGLGLSLELRGDPAAIDTMRSALRLSSDPKQKLRMLGTLVWLDLKAGVAGDLDALREARRSADSALRVWPPTQTDREAAEVLGRFAAMTGRCVAAATGARRAVSSSMQAIPISDRTVAETQARLITVALGCKTFSPPAPIDGLLADAGVDRLPENARLGVALSLFDREIRSAETLDTVWAARFAPYDYLLSARLAAERGQLDSVRKVFERLQKFRQFTPRGGVTPDAAVPEALTWLRLGDSASAVRWLDGILDDARFYPPMFGSEFDNMVLTAFLTRAVVLRADLSVNLTDRRRWATAALTLLDGADEGLAPTVSRLRRYVR